MWRILILAVVASMVGVARADKVIKSNGSEIEGKIIDQSDTTVTIETVREGKLVRVPIFRETIARIEKSVYKPTTAPATRPSEDAQRKREEYVARLAAESKDRAEKFAEAKEKKAAAIKEAQEARDQYMEKIKPDLTEIDNKLEDVRTRGKAAEESLADLQKQLKSETDDADRELRQANSDSNRMPDPTQRSRWQMTAQRKYADRIGRAKERLQPLLDAQQKKVNELAKEQQQLISKRNALLAAAPVVPK
jgi:chromosome segregation ATPase